MASFKPLKDAKLTDKKIAYQARLENAGFESEADLDAAIKKIEESMKRARKKDLGEDAPPEVSPSPHTATLRSSFARGDELTRRPFLFLTSLSAHLSSSSFFFVFAGRTFVPVDPDTRR